MAKVLHGAGSGLDRLAECEACFLTGETKLSETAAFSALYSAQQAGQHDLAGNALFILLRLYNIMGDYRGVCDTLEKIDLLASHPDAAGLGIWDVARGWFFSEMDAVSKVAGWILNGAQTGQPPISVSREFLVRARCLIATDQDAQAMALLNHHEEKAAAKNAVIALLYIDIYRGVIFNRLGDHAAAMHCLKSAYNRARGNRLVMPFIEYGNRTRSVLERGRNTKGLGVPADWLDQIHAKSATYAKRHTHLAARFKQEHGHDKSRYSLTKREAELLSNLSQGLTRDESADSMQLSLNTVKSMLKQIYNKLGAINNADAVRIAVNEHLI
jgi:LuxR family maltose regulon positive regulatory protein